MASDKLPMGWEADLIPQARRRQLQVILNRADSDMICFRQD